MHHRLILLMLSVCTIASAAPGPANAPTWEKTVERVTRAVVALKVRATRDFDTERAGASGGTGFVIDRERGIILTNRHMVHSGPVVAEAVFLNHEEVPLQAIYRDPVHDFGFYRFDPSLVRHMDIVELDLDAAAARVGMEIRVIGNDEGEKISILDGTLARIDRSAPDYGGSTYNDFNTFYLQAASNTSGGSSGSPVVSLGGTVIGLNAGGSRGGASSFYLPLQRVMRAIPYIKRGERPPRGTLQATFVYTSYDELRRLGLTAQTETKTRAANPGATGMLVVSRAEPYGPAYQILEPGDVLIEANGRSIPDFVTLESILDDSVGGPVVVQIERGGTRRTIELTIGDLHAITPASFLEVSRGIFHELSFQQARNYNLGVAGVYVAQPGYAFAEAGVPKTSLITAVDAVKVANLRAFQSELEGKGDGQRVRIRYYKLKDPAHEHEAVVTMDRAWHPMRLCTLDTSGAWPCVSATAAPEPRSPEPTTVLFPKQATRSTRAVASSLVVVDFDIAIPTAGVKNADYRGTGIVVDSVKGLIIVDRDTVPVRLGDIQVTFGGQVRIPAEVVYLHPVHNVAVLHYEPSLLGSSSTTQVDFVDREFRVGQRVWQVALDGSHQIVDFETSIAKKGPVSLSPSRTPRFRDINVDGFSLTDSLSSLGGVVVDKRGRALGAWFSFNNPGAGESYFRVLPSAYIERVVAPLRKGEPVAYRGLGAEVQLISLATARDRGLSAERTRQIIEHDPHQRKVMEVSTLWGGSPAMTTLQQGDLLLTVDGSAVTAMHELEAVTDRMTLDLLVLRDGVERSVTLSTVPLKGEGVQRLVSWAGLVLHDPHHEVATQTGTLRKGAYGSWVWYGTPAFGARLRPTRRVVQVNGEQVESLDHFIELVRGLKDRQAVRLMVEGLDGRVAVHTLKMDLQYWPTELVEWVDGRWKRTEIVPNYEVN